MAKKIQIKDWSNKNNTFVYDANMTPLGFVECFCSTEFKAFRADGTFIDWFGSKTAAMKAL